MIDACGSQSNLYVPFFRVTVQVLFPTKPTDVSLLSPGPFRWKLWMFDLSRIRIAYLPAFSVVTFLPALVSVIVKPGPSVPTSFVAVVDADATATDTAMSAATS